MTARLTIAVDNTEAELVCGLLRTEGIRCFHRATDLTAHTLLSGPGGWREILVNEEDVRRARELVDAAASAVDECMRCGREVGLDGGWYPDAADELLPYCGVCAERLFGQYGLA